MLIKKLLFFIILALLTYPSLCNAATWTAASCSASDVQTAMNKAAAGDTVAIPACNSGVGWTTAVSWNPPPNVTLTGAGATAEGGGDQTVIIDNYAANASLLSIIIPSTGVFRMTGITIEGGSGALKDNGILDFGGPGTLRIDHCHFDTREYTTTSAAQAQKIPVIGNGIYGVMDHCILDLFGNSAPYIVNGGGTDGQGNSTWTQPTDFGGSDFFFIEDNAINGYVDSGISATRVSDGWSASREVVRFNSLHDCSGPEQHGTGHAGDDRGFRAIEFYGNSATADSAALNASNGPNFDMMMIQTGGALVWGNDSTNGGLGCYKNGIIFDVTRKDNTTYIQAATPNGWGYCGTDFNGTGSGWDQNTVVSTGTRCIDQPGSGPGDLISGSPSGNGSFPNKVDATTGTITWPHQTLEPVYTWGNRWVGVPGWGTGITLYGNGSCTTSGCRILQNDPDYSNQPDYSTTQPASYYPQAGGIQTSPTSPFNGTNGTGWGTLANRPTTCTTGVAYWATDQGSWNQSSSNPYGVQMSGQSGTLYTCSATNTWTLYYTPYMYPNPLQGGSSPTTYTLTPTAGSHGSISPSTAVTVNSGGSQAFTIAPDAGYVISSILVDGSPVAPLLPTYSFSSVAADHSLSLTFAPVVHSPQSPFGVRAR